MSCARKNNARVWKLGMVLAAWNSMSLSLLIPLNDYDDDNNNNNEHILTHQVEPEDAISWLKTSERGC
jgi:hypothetical protein